MEPDCGAVSSRISCSVVDFPEPDSPTMPSVRPRGRSKLIPSTARTSPILRRNTTPLVSRYVFTRSRTLTTTSGSDSSSAMHRLGGHAVDLGRSAARRPLRCGCTPPAWPSPTGRQRRFGSVRHVVDRQRAARRERAARRQGSPATAARRESAPADCPAASPVAGPSPTALRCRAFGDRGTARRPPATSTARPAYITRARSANSATTPRSWVMISTPAPVTSRAVCEHLEDLRLHGDVERGGRLVADQQVGVVGDRDGDDDALAFTAGQFVWERAGAAVGLRMPTSSSNSTARVRAAALTVAVGAPGWPRRSDRRRCRPGSAPTSDPGTPCRSPGRGPATSRRRTARSARRRRSRTEPDTSAYSGSSPITAIAAADLPDPDSPTIATTSRGAT